MVVCWAGTLIRADIVATGKVTCASDTDDTEADEVPGCNVIGCFLVNTAVLVTNLQSLIQL